MEPLNNKDLADKIRLLGQLRGLMSDAAICAKANIDNRMAIKNIAGSKMAPRLDTIIKFANALDVSVEALIYPDIQEIDNNIYQDISDAINEFLKAHRLSMSAKKRQEAVKDFYRRGFDKERIVKELLNLQRIFITSYTKTEK